MGNALNTRQSDRTSPLHRAGRRAGAAARIHQKITKNAKSGPRPRTATAASTEEGNLNPAHLGSDFEDFLKEEGLFETVQVLAIKKVIAYKLVELMRQERLTKDALAKRMRTSRAALDRLLDPANPSVTLVTLGKAACALKRTLRIELL
jgi:antitoxin HicB